MTTLTESIREQGILSPLLVRPLGETDEYEIVSGHRRYRAARLAGLKQLPAIVCDMDRDSAAIALVDSNLHREHILPSEKAFAYKLKADALNHQGVACGQSGHKSRDDISDTESGRTVQRYIRLTRLIPELLTMMDEGKIALSVGVELSYLSADLQRAVVTECGRCACTPSYAQANRMHKLSFEDGLDAAVIQQIMSEEKANQREILKIPVDRLKTKLPGNLSARQQEEFILKALDYYARHLRRQREQER